MLIILLMIEYDQFRKNKTVHYLHLERIKCINGMCQTVHNFFILWLKCPWKTNIKGMISDFLRVKELIKIWKFLYILLTKNSIPYNKCASIIFVYAITISACEKNIKNIFKKLKLQFSKYLILNPFTKLRFM